MIRETTLLAVLLAAPVTTEARSETAGIFTVSGKGDSATVSANRNGVAADVALRELSKVMSWGFRPATDKAVADLSRSSVDLSFSDQNPRIIAQLIAVAAGMDVTFDDRTTAVGFEAVMHVAPGQTGDTPAGRERLRNWAIHWYRNFLAVDSDPLVEEQGMKVYMHLGHLRLQQGDLPGAIRAFSKVHEAGSTNTNYWTTALLRMAEASFELGKLEDAEKWAKELTRQHPKLRPTAQATVLLGKVLLEARGKNGTTRYDECVRFLESSYLRLASAPEIIDIYLLVAEAQRRRDRPDKMLRVLDILASARPTSEWSRRQWLDYHFLRGVAAEGVAQSLKSGKEQKLRFLEARQAMELFIGVGSEDPRRGIGFVVLGQAYMGTNRFLEARSAAIEAIGHRARMEKQWLQRAQILEAKTALVLGDPDVAFMNLETQVRKPTEQKPGLILFLVDALIDSGRYQQAITNSDLLSGQENIWGDRARYRRVLAMFKNAEDTGIYKGFAEEAIKIARLVRDPKLQRKVAEIIGKAYESQGMVDKAADAYRGMLR